MLDRTKTRKLFSNALQKKLFKIEIKNYVCTCDTSRSNRWQSASAAIRTRTIHCSIEKTKLHNVCTRCTSTGAEIGGFEHEKTSALCWRVNCSGKPPRAAPFRTEEYGSDTQPQKTNATCHYMTRPRNTTSRLRITRSGPFWLLALL